MAIKIIIAIANCFYVFGLLIVARCLLTWIPNLNWENKFIKHVIKEPADLYLNLFKFIPPLGPFDFSPIVALIVLQVLRDIVIKGAIIIFSMLGIIG
ncbi:MAG: YggT family protein [Cyanobacteria bacterium SIG26]|nr:YggT family protein [Cyanobacteria bacterium SIG26]